MSSPQPPPLNSSPSPKAPGLAIASLIFGILSILGGIVLIVPAILAIVFGHVARSQCRRNNIVAGQGMSLAGLILGYLSIAVIPIIGLMAAMAIPAFQKVRIASQEKVMQNNVRQLAAAADQYYLDYAKSEATFDDIVGPGKSVPRLQPVFGEKYPRVFQKNVPIKVTKSDGKVLVFDPASGSNP
jgi:type IV pilus assembly protein PilA